MDTTVGEIGEEMQHVHWLAGMQEFKQDDETSLLYACFITQVYLKLHESQILLPRMHI